jgi:hypothetical protein
MTTNNVRVDGKDTFWCNLDAKTYRAWERRFLKACKRAKSSPVAAAEAAVNTLRREGVTEAALTEELIGGVLHYLFGHLLRR